MEKKDTLKSLLGIGQEQIAVLLGITRSQWAMYEIGKRNLPLHAALELTKILHYMQRNDFKSIETLHFVKEEEEKIPELLKKEVQLNRYKVMALDKKIETAQKLRDQSLTALRLAEYLDNHANNERAAIMNTPIRSRAMDMLKKNNEIIRKHTLDKETLTLRNAAIAKILKAPDMSA